MDKGVALTWQNFWSIFMASNPEERRSLAKQIDLTNWLPSCPRDARTEVLKDAPREVGLHYWPILDWETKFEILKDAPPDIVAAKWPTLEFPARKKFLNYHGIERPKSINGRPNRNQFALPKGF